MMADLPAGWERKVSRSTGQEYFLNQYTKESRWELPTEPAQREGDTVQCSHLLVKHSGSRRPSSWREENITRSKDEARVILQGFRNKITSKEASFAELAAKYSDCSSAKRAGDLGPFGRGQMQKPFEDATFAMQVGELSEIVSTDSGEHIILRTA
ncbi:putative peptidyl-prolyl cis-trans isomerase dodo [Mizuhopecten yessoensis]|uniref:Peptidyl-prolyl cis-trans isomerase n=1 Tax=Mizuhopecten yessoensis TaxID=6573 RepID=A0A210Q437_MIZYE|nr:putative peptidyl-prolyl cis-trans isomerase dodo [Mizuhopecten yessoensis]OWF43507.1 peptidyl-prolyl cis-trans isomerase dodo [Mizuhopecten yessoensis]